MGYKGKEICQPLKTAFAQFSNIFQQGRLIPAKTACGFRIGKISDWNRPAVGGNHSKNLGFPA